MALALLAVDDDGHRAGNTKNCKVPFLKVLYEVWKNMAEDGVITEVCLRGLIQKATTTKNSRMDFQLPLSVQIANKL